MVSVENRLEMPKAQLWAMVEEPTPPLAPMKAMVRPSGSDSGSTKIAEMAAITSAMPTGATMYSEIPLRISSR
ncbi:hypothetical protein D3C72_1474480 [compost metagenome]